jgi:hypothetical protein
VIAALSILSALTVCVIGWALQHAQRCAERDRQYEQRLTRLEDRVK